MILSLNWYFCAILKVLLHNVRFVSVVINDHKLQYFELRQTSKLALELSKTKVAGSALKN